MPDISPIPAFADNYIWLVRGDDGAVVVDPGDAGPVLERLDREGLELRSILVTHHHGDHVGGIPALLQRFPGIPVYGPAGEAIPTLTHRLGHGDRVVPAGLDTEFEVLEVPGHTAGHIAYHGDGALFCGDTLFACGCGRLFEGTAEQMAASLGRIRALPPQTRVYCAHEYTLVNIGFAKWVEPDNAHLLAREEADTAARREGRPTVPSTLELELRTNPFLRWDDPAVIAAAGRYAGHDVNGAAHVFGAVRRWKDREDD